MYATADVILAKAAESTRSKLAAMRESVKKEYSETRSELKSSETPDGSAPPEGTPEPEVESLEEWVAWRNEQTERTRNQRF